MTRFQTETLWIEQPADGVAALVLDVPGKKVNVLNQPILADLERALEHVAGGSYEVLIVRSGKPDNFCAGADLDTLPAQTPEQLVALVEQGQRVLTKLADLEVPSVAVIAGSCLGGGLELALACDFRVVVDKPNVQLGLPEVELGLLPAWGGTQRLPRVVGIERALPMILGGRRLGAREALAAGLADELTPPGSDEPPAVLADLGKRPRHKLPLRTWRQWLVESNPLGRWLIFRGAKQALRRRVPDDMHAPWEALQAIRIGIRSGSDAGLAYEREAFAFLITTPACRNLVRLFVQREEARKAPEQKRPDARTIRRVGIIGAGTMGAAIAHLAIMRGFEVVIKEANEMALGLAMLRLMGLCKQSVDKGKLAADDLERKLAAIHGTVAWKGFDRADLVVEAIPENLNWKHALFEEMEKHVAASAILTSVTSSLPIAKLAAGLKHPERVAGLHFGHPVGRVPLVEVAATEQTASGVRDNVRDWVRRLGRTPVIVKDAPGFLLYRLLAPYWNEAALLLQEGIPPHQIDDAMLRFGMPQGPLEHMDQLGLDEVATVVQAVSKVLGDRLQPTPLFERMLANEWLGCKSGAGFYRYRGARKKKHAALAGLAAAVAGDRRPPAIRSADRPAHVRDRLVHLLMNEAARCALEGWIDADRLDLAVVLGGGFAPHRGGPLRYGRDTQKGSG